MLRDVFYYGIKPNVHPREKFAKNLKDARDQATTEYFWIINEYCDYTNFDWDFDFDFLPDDDVWAQDHNNVWPSQHQKDSGTWLCPKKISEVIIYRSDVDIVRRKPIKENFVILQKVDTSKFDFSWHPDPTDPPYIYCWGNKFFPPQFGHALEYHVKNATEVKYMSTVVELLPNLDNYEVFDDIEFFDFSWIPDPGSPPYIYVWGNQWNKPEDKISIKYVVEGATEYKYMRERVTRKPSLENWELPKNINSNGFDFSWEPSPADPPYIYEFGTQWQKTGGPRYVVADAIEFKYIDFQKVIALPSKDQWVIPNNIEIDNFDFSWHPDNTDPAYIYQFGTQWALSGGPKYVVNGASEVKYVDDLIAVALPNKENWEVNDFIDTENFDYSWHPYAEDEPYIYQFGTQWQKTGGPRYITPGVHKNSPIKYIDTRILKAKRLPNKKGYAILNNYKIKDFDYSWHPDETDEPYIYVFGNNQYPAEIMPTIEYVVPGAKQIKYVNDIVAVLDQDKTNWVITQAIDDNKFDFSWKPNPTDPPYIYRWGNKYISKKYKPTIEYHVADATDIKYMDDDVNVIPEWERWIIPKDIDTTGFDFTWRPDPLEPDYIYEFGTQWQKTGGPVYKVPNATEYKYLNSQKVKALPNKNKWLIPNNIEIDNFDFSWHPDSTDPAYIYQFGTQWALSGGPKYVVEGATEIKYVDDLIAIALPNKENWVVPIDIDESSFDFSWHPYAEDEPYIYQFGTQWQKTGGPKYITPGTTGVSATKYIDVRILKSKRLPTMNNWVVPKNIVIKSFDYSWHPDATDELFVYEFGTQWHEKGGPKYVPPGAKIGITPTKYIPTTSCVAILDINMKHWEVPNNIDRLNFDYSWVPHPDESTYIYQFGTQHQKTGGPKYITMGSNNKTPVKYIETLKAIALPNKSKFKILQNLKIKDFDYSWHPDETEQPYIYIFGNNQHTAEVMPTIEYKAGNATEIKYINDIKAILDIDLKNWIIPNDLDTSNFDFSWKPNPHDPPYIYQFGTQWQKTGGPRYVVEGATETKYIDFSKAKKLENKNLFKVIDGLKIKDFDYSWHPDETEQPYIYIFGNNQYSAEVMPTIEYRMPNAKEIKYVNNNIAILATDKKHWKIPDDIDVESFDFSWKPNPHDPPYIYQFGTQHQKTGGPKYILDGAIETKYIDSIKAKRKASKHNWEIPNHIKVDDFDFSWHPDELAPPYIYQFGTLLDSNDGPRYVTPNNNKEVVNKLRLYIEPVVENTDDIENIEVDTMTPVNIYYIKTTLQDLINEHPNEVFWALNKDIDYNNFDFNYRPNIEQAKFIHSFGYKDNIDVGTYFVSSTMYDQGNKEFNYIQLTEPINYITNIFYVDKGNKNSELNFQKLQNRFGKRIQKTRYLNSWVETINRCINRSTSTLCWILNSELDYSEFNFEYYPNIWQIKMVHVFGTQYNHWGTTFLVNKNTFAVDTKYIKVIEHLSNLNFVKNITAKSISCNYDVYCIDFKNNNSKYNIDKVITNIQKPINVIDYDTDYTTTLKKLVNSLPNKKENYIWICSSICDYTDFDFNYIVDPFSREDLHVFPSNNQKMGDTFFVDGNKLKEQLEKIDNLKLYNKINYNYFQKTSRDIPPVIISDESHVSNILDDFDFPYAVFITKDNNELTHIVDEEPISLWSDDTKNIIITSTGGSRVIVPKEVKNHFESQLYDYPYIKTNNRLHKSNPMDIVFLSNGETCADSNYEHLLKITKGLKNRVVKVENIKGRAEAYKEAAKASNTPWMFTVFAKLKVNPKFDFNWQPDRLQVPKHYIFHAKNPVNNLVYGHQGIIMYNKKLVLSNIPKGLDFTLDSPHETIPLLSGEALYNTDEFTTWRTAFREVIKLKCTNTKESLERLQIWLTVGNNNYGEYSIKGAIDGIEYYEDVDGDINKLKCSYEWQWLNDYFCKKI